MACIKCRKFREHHRSLNLTKSAFTTIYTGMRAETVVSIEVKGRKQSYRQDTVVRLDGTVLLTLGTWVSDLPAYWHISFSIKVYILNKAHEAVFWTDDQEGSYNEIRFRTSLGIDHAADVILNDQAILVVL